METRETFLNGRRLAAIGTSLSAVALLVGFGLASARNDDGSHTFFLQQASNDTAAVEPVASRSTGRGVTLTFRDHRKLAQTRKTTRVAARPTELRVRVAGPKAPVTLLTDATLRAGDAVMTPKGIRIFLGSAALPHRESDFVALATVDGMPRAVARTLLAMDNTPRG